MNADQVLVLLLVVGAIGHLWAPVMGAHLYQRGRR